MYRDLLSSLKSEGDVYVLFIMMIYAKFYKKQQNIGNIIINGNTQIDVSLRFFFSGNSRWRLLAGLMLCHEEKKGEALQVVRVTIHFSSDRDVGVKFF